MEGNITNTNNVNTTNSVFVCKYKLPCGWCEKLNKQCSICSSTLTFPDIPNITPTVPYNPLKIYYQSTNDETSVTQHTDNEINVTHYNNN